jgi:hypothetical protein
MELLKWLAGGRFIKQINKENKKNDFFLYGKKAQIVL